MEAYWVDFLIWVPPILFAITIHEFFHGWTADRLGDPTARMAGRLTLNPLAHLDPIGTLMLLIVHFGWARPVPVNPYNLRNPKKDIIWVSLAGPAANFLTAFACGLIIRVLNIVPADFSMDTPVIGILLRMLVYGLVINLVLAFFNLIPLPPLDGSKILLGLLPGEYEYKFVQFERFGPFILMGIIFLSYLSGINIFGMFFLPLVRIFSLLFAGIDFGTLL
jgi:Zn-dependent protease